MSKIQTLFKLKKPFSLKKMLSAAFLLQRVLFSARFFCKNLLGLLLALTVFYPDKTNICRAFVGQWIGIFFFQKASHVVVLRVIHRVKFICLIRHAECIGAVAVAADGLLEGEFAVFIHNKEIIFHPDASFEIFGVTPLPMAGGNEKFIADALEHDPL